MNRFKIDIAAVARREQHARARAAELQSKHKIPDRDILRLMSRYELESDEFHTAEEKAMRLWLEGKRA